jgi:transposase
MAELSSHILTALDDAVAQEVGARLLQVAKNTPRGGSPPALPIAFEEGLKRLKTLHQQVRLLVERIFADAGSGTVASGALLSLPGLQQLTALETRASSASDETALNAGPEGKHGLARHSSRT